ncbi:N-formylglutamate amidohydrolase [Brevundimonas sp.]|uniref:N-formylglutamate amidohydrolase n=1 Tax=Brevundimonas sp. TaxID=1871086 RepID=UPI001DFCF416|nr:N-formylglutamate amidohydrolase [Brevundimonas sp.]MBL0946852.1 N-formylglutamate amidohydrolase [Brevundimonas sp.]
MTGEDGDASAGAPFRLLSPVGDAASPLVFASPHSGRLYPASAGFDPDLADVSLRSAEDALVDRLIEGAPGQGIPVLLATHGRAWLDLNRAPDDLDPGLIHDLPAGAGGGPRAGAGYGVVPRLTGDGRPLYRERLSLAEVTRRIATVHTPYHAALDVLMEQARARHGVAVLIDWHSMPGPRASPPARRPLPGFPQIVLGDRHGASCATALTRRVSALLGAEGLKVALNQPYAGGWTTERRGRPGEGFHALQIELSRTLYLDEARIEPGPGWARCQGVVNRLIDTLAREAIGLVS